MHVRSLAWSIVCFFNLHSQYHQMPSPRNLLAWSLFQMTSYFDLLAFSSCCLLSPQRSFVSHSVKRYYFPLLHWIKVSLLLDLVIRNRSIWGNGFAWQVRYRLCLAVDVKLYQTRRLTKANAFCLWLLMYSSTVHFSKVASTFRLNHFHISGNKLSL